MHGQLSSGVGSKFGSKPSVSSSLCVRKQQMLLRVCPDSSEHWLGTKAIQLNLSEAASQK